MIHLVGSGAYRNNGTFVLGTAEGGLKITMYFVNEMRIEPAYLNEYYFKTMHHEFAHILHQKKPYSTDFNLISGSDYVTDAWSDTWSGDADAQKNGFISEYASKEANEDFVELIAVYVTSTAAEWNSVIKNAGDGAAIINAKFDIVYNYMLNTWGINLDDLREVVQRRQSEIETLDLETL
jgi:substrate import-associated zinc metallohydrolase lipoprotein